jgi:hypothetical protein
MVVTISFGLSLSKTMLSLILDLITGATLAVNSSLFEISSVHETDAILKIAINNLDIFSYCLYL